MEVSAKTGDSVANIFELLVSEMKRTRNLLVQIEQREGEIKKEKTEKGTPKTKDKAKAQKVQHLCTW